MMKPRHTLSFRQWIPILAGVLLVVRTLRTAALRLPFPGAASRVSATRAPLRPSLPGTRFLRSRCSRTVDREEPAKVLFSNWTARPAWRCRPGLGRAASETRFDARAPERRGLDERPSRKPVGRGDAVFRERTLSAGHPSDSVRAGRAGNRPSAQSIEDATAGHEGEHLGRHRRFLPFTPSITVRISIDRWCSY